MIDKKQNAEITERLGFVMMIALAAGFMDAYSYIVRGSVFATGQTGNFVLVAVRLAEKEYAAMFQAIVPIISFWIGVFIASHMLYSYFKEDQLLWKRGILIIEIISVTITGFIPCSYPNVIANSLVSFAASLQFCAFKKFGTSDNYASIFCTGNMRSCAENYYKGIIKKNKQSLKKAVQYSSILTSFFVGAIIGALEGTIFHEKAIWTVGIVLSAALILSFVLNTDMWKNPVLVDKDIKEQI